MFITWHSAVRNIPFLSVSVLTYFPRITMESQFLILVNGLQFVTITIDFDIRIAPDLSLEVPFRYTLCPSNMLASFLSLSYFLAKQDFPGTFCTFPLQEKYKKSDLESYLQRLLVPFEVTNVI